MPRVRDHNSISLFPFLAVLVCAMGALILLLLVTTRRIRTEALERAYEAAQAVETVDEPVEPTPASEPDVPPLVEVEPQAPPPADVEDFQPRAIALGPAVEAPRPPPRPIDPNPDLRGRIESLLSQRELARRKLQALEADLQAARDRGAELQARLNRTREQQAEARSAREQARRRIGELEAGQQRLRAQIHEAERRIAEAEQQPASPSQFVVVPYDGVSGTNRRPILIEFTGDGIRFIPENIVLRKDDFEGFTPGYNPLLAGTRALVEYWTERSRRSGGQEPLPYVLLIVRPSGVEYYPLRLLLERLEQPFGYELLEESQELALPEVDPVAAELCRIAVERMMTQRNALLQIVRGDGAAGPGGGGASGARDGFTPAGEREASGTPAGDGFASGGAGDDAGERRGPVFRGYQRPSYDLVEPDSGIVLPSQRRRPMVVHVPGGRRGGGPGANVSPGPGHRASGDGPGAASAVATGSAAGGAASPGRFVAGTGDQGTPATAGPASGLPTGSEQAGRSNPAASATPDSAASGWAPFRTASRNDGDFSRSDTAGTGGGGLEPDPLLSGRPSTASPSMDENVLVDAEPSDPFEAALRGETTGTAGPASSLSEMVGGSLSATSAGQGQPSAASASMSGATGSSAAGAAAAGQAGSGAGSSSLMPPAGADELPVPAMTLPTITLRNSELADLPPHRRRWGLSSPRATIGYERELQIEVGADRLIVGGEHVVRAGLGETREELSGRMVTAIEAAARGWGPPPDAFYWVPALRFTVAPGGNRHYERLRGPLRAWGLQSAATYTLDPPRAAARSTP